MYLKLLSMMVLLTVSFSSVFSSVPVPAIFGREAYYSIGKNTALIDRMVRKTVSTPERLRSASVDGGLRRIDHLQDRYDIAQAEVYLQKSVCLPGLKAFSERFNRKTSKEQKVVAAPIGAQLASAGVGNDIVSSGITQSFSGFSIAPFAIGSDPDRKIVTARQALANRIKKIKT